jgi:hypothetical protein
MKIPVILRCAAWMVPIEDRPEWLAEWGGEAAHVRRSCKRPRLTVFCLGAFPDALWHLRNGQSARGILCIESPVRCLLFLTALATAAAYLVARSPAMNDSRPEPYRDAERLAMVSRHFQNAPRLADIPVAEYRARADRTNGPFDEVSFYVVRAPLVRSRRFALAIASPNLFRLLGVPVSASGLILTRSAWRRYFDSDPGIVGQTIQINGKPARIAAIIPDSAWRLPGYMEGWLLDAARLAELPPDTNGFMVARLQSGSQSNLRWPMATPNERGMYGVLVLSPLPQDQSVLNVLLLIAFALILLPLTTSLSLGEFSAGCDSRRWPARIRWWMFFGVKIALLLPIVFGGLYALGVLLLAPQGAIVSLVLALRWALLDQRNRCPVCLRPLSHPVRIGEASHTFLAWYGTELLCTRGHGLLHVPEIRTSCYAEQRWSYLDPSWTS